MSQNRKALLRYKELDRCLNYRYHKYFIEDLVDKCNSVLIKAGIVPVSKRQVQADLAFMKSSEGWSAPIVSIQDGKRKYIRYSEDFSIMNTPITEMELEQLETLITSLSRFQGIPMYDWIEELLTNLRFRFGVRGTDVNVIGFERNGDLHGLEYLPQLINCTIKKIPVAVRYQPFGKEAAEWVVHPYYLKQYNNRWFLLGYNEQFEDLSVLALDRILKLNYSDVTFIRNKSFNFDTYFQNIIGVSIEKGRNIEHILLKFTPERLPYVISKPLHHSQIVENEEKGIVSIDVIPNKELISELIWFKDDVEVLSPVSLRKEIKGKISAMHKIYFPVKNSFTTDI